MSVVVRVSCLLCDVVDLVAEVATVVCSELSTGDVPCGTSVEPHLGVAVGCRLAVYFCFDRSWIPL